MSMINQKNVMLIVDGRLSDISAAVEFLKQGLSVVMIEKYCKHEAIETKF